VTDAELRATAVTAIQLAFSASDPQGFAALHACVADLDEDALRQLYTASEHLGDAALLGYNYQLVSVSSAHIGGDGNPYAPQWRDRLYIVFTRKGIPLPDVDPKPLVRRRRVPPADAQTPRAPACPAVPRFVHRHRQPGRADDAGRQRGLVERRAVARRSPCGGAVKVIQETLDQALVRPADRRVWAHVGCGGWVLFDLRGGFCVECGAGPIPPAEYAKPP
jgi:hypothetical protein